MRNPLIGLLVAAAAFFCGAAVQNLFQPEQVYIVENAVAAPVLDTADKYISLNEIVELKIKENEQKIEADEPSSEDNFDSSAPVYGWYSPDSFDGMEEINTILLSKDYEDAGNQKLVSSASIFVGKEDFAEKQFTSIRAEINNRRVAFRTKKIKGVEYRFKGVFFKGKTGGFDGEKVLRGTLQKFVRGRKAAEISADFAYYEPRCWH